MDKNLILAVSLSVLIYAGWFKFIEKRYGHPPPAPVAATAARPAELPRADLARAEEITVESDGIAVKIQPMGAALSSFRYPDALGPVELVEYPADGLLVTWPQLRFSQVGGPGSLAFEASLPSGARVRKEFRFVKNSRMHSLQLTLTNPKSAELRVDEWELSAGPGLGTVASEQKENADLWSAIALLKSPAGKTHEPLLKPKPKDPDASHAEPWKWVGLHNRYFLLAMLPAADSFASFDTGGREVGKVRAPWVRLRAAARTLAPGESLAVELPFYLGPKGYTHLRSFGLGLERAVDFGWFDPLGRGAYWVLMSLQNLVGNWGWSIMLLTVALQLLLFPFTYKSLKSAAAMRKIQPDMARLQQQFGKDPQRLNAEMLQLYKKHGANPLGGCLPMLAQMPIVVALYNTLRNAWELHGARWALWIKDLSAHDPLYVLPIAMGAVMFLQAKANPTPTTDPTQAKMMTFMPIIFTFMFLNVPSGLVLYWFTSSTLNFAQQMALKDRL